MNKYRILHIPTNQFLRKKSSSLYGTSWPPFETISLWRAKYLLYKFFKHPKTVGELYVVLLDSNVRDSSTLAKYSKPEFIIVSTNTSFALVDKK